MNHWGLLFVGALFGMALVIACESGMNTKGRMTMFGDGGLGAGKDAQAAPSDCATWQITAVASNTTPDGTFSYTRADGTQEVLPRFDMPPGWEPFGAMNAAVFVRRCKP
jgi:hypothetical protein